MVEGLNTVSPSIRRDNYVASQHPTIACSQGYSVSHVSLGFEQVGEYVLTPHYVV